MKICIITLIGYNNYGNRLQHFAMNSLLKAEGFEVESWRRLYVREELLNGNSKKALSKMVKSLLPLHIFAILVKILELKSSWKYRHSDRMILKKEKALKNFTWKYIGKPKTIYANSYSELKRKIDNCKIDFFITGSDQVWNPEWDRDGYFFLKFAPPFQRLSFAASFGVSEIPYKEKNRIAELLRNMAFVSVREEAGVEIVKELSGREAQLTLDPTLLLGKEEWDKYVNKVKVETPKHYIATYFLGDIPDAVYEFAREKKLPLVQMNNRKEKQFFALDPLQFCYVIRNSDYVLTDSFHGTVFSILFERQFYVFNRIGLKQDMFSRIQSLVDVFGLQSRIQSNDKIIQTEDISPDQWLEIKKRIIQSREKSMSRLIAAMGVERVNNGNDYK